MSYNIMSYKLFKNLFCGVVVFSAANNIEASPVKDLPLEDWQYSCKIIDNKTGDIIGRPIANNPVVLHGFDVLHEQGITGEGIQIAFLETGVKHDHIQFREGQVSRFDCSQAKVIDGEDRSLRRLGRLEAIRLCVRIEQKHSNTYSHGNHVMGTVLAQPKKYEYGPSLRVITPQVSFSKVYEGPTYDRGSHSGETSLDNVTAFVDHPGGCVPQAKGIIYSYSEGIPSEVYLFQGGALFSLRDVVTKDKNVSFLHNKAFDIGRYSEFKADLESPENTPRDIFDKWIPLIVGAPLTAEDWEYVSNSPIDDSSINAMNLALEGPAFAINWSATPPGLQDPNNDYRMPKEILDHWADLAEKNDKIIVFCSNNWTTCLEDMSCRGFFEQFFTHEILSKRVVLSINVSPVEAGYERELGQVEIHHKEVPFALYYSSNYPGDFFSPFSLCAVGSDILSGYGETNFFRGSGTSEAAPIIAALASLVKQKYTDMTGPDVIQRLKDTARPLGDKKYSGSGYIWAPAALGM